MSNHGKRMVPEDLLKYTQEVKALYPDPSEIGGGGDVTAEAVYNVMEGSETVVVDLNEDETAVEVHLDSEVVSKIDNSLQMPLTTPTEQELVGIDTTGAQNRITIGDGLSVEEDELKTIYTIDMESSTSVTLSEADFAKFTDAATRPTFIRVKTTNTGSNAKLVNNGVFQLDILRTNKSTSQLYYVAPFNSDYSGTSSNIVGNLGIDYYTINANSLIYIEVSLSNRRFSIGNPAYRKFATNFAQRPEYKLDVTTASGSFSNAAAIYSHLATYSYIITVDSVSYVVFFAPRTLDSTNKKIYCYGELWTADGLSKKYLLTIDYDAKTYAITEITQ